MKVVIMGCGRVGGRLAGLLDADGHDVTVMDLDSYSFRRLPGTFRGRPMVGNGMDQDDQRRAGIEEADAFVAVTQGDNRNVMACQIAKHIFGVSKSVCRIYDPVRQNTYKDLGLESICPTIVGAQLLRDALGFGGDQTSVYILIVGGGKVGYYLARSLVNEGHEILLIEQNAKKCDRIAEELGSVVMRGDGCEASTLADAGTERADIVVAVTGGDEDNLVICQVAKKRFGVGRAIARINNPKNEEVFRRLGIDVTISSTNVILEHIEHELPTRNLIHLMSFRNRTGLEIVELQIPPGSPVIGRRLRDIDLPPDSVVALVVSERAGAQVPTADTIFNENDEIVAVTQPDREVALRRVLAGEYR